MDSKPKLHCICKPKGCRHGVPDYCVANDYRDEIERARRSLFGLKRKDDRMV